MKLRPLLISCAIAAVLASVPALAAGATRRPAPGVIHAAGAEVFPHSGDYDARTGTFYVGSLKHSTVSAVNLQGAVHTFVDDPALVSVSAVRVDDEHDRLLASNVDYGLADHSAAGTTFHVAGVAAYDLHTGRRLWYADLGATAAGGQKHLISDIAIAPAGTAYAVDELSPTIFRIDRHGHATEFATGELLAGTASVPGFLSGLGMAAATWEPGNELLISEADGTLLRVPVAHPERAGVVPLSQPLAPLTAGIRALPDGSLVAVSSGLLTGKPARIQLIRPVNGWAGATVTVTGAVADPVTSDVIAGPGGSTYALSGGLAALLAGRPNSGFTLTRVSVR